MRRYCLILLLYFIPRQAIADHITGGEMYYTFAGFTNGLYTYDVTLKLFMRCNSGRQFPDPAVISVFDRGSLSRIQDINVNLFYQRTIQILDSDPCISDPPRVCYEVAYYYFRVALPSTASGYTLASQVNYRINGINNLTSFSQTGATYSCEIPGTIAPGNNSASFTGSDLVIVCAGNFFSYSFAATDPDGDALRYSFCSAFNSTSPGPNAVPVGPPPYEPVPYNAPGYSSGSPMGSRVVIDPQTGLITGVAPPGGIYVVTVCVEEIRGGQVISTQRKDLQIHVADCSVAAAQLEEEYMLCGDTRVASIKNISNSPLIVSYDWTLFNEAGNAIHNTESNTLNYTFPQNGTYSVQLIVNKNGACTDTGYAKVLVYPGLNPAFSASGICNTNPTIFRDETTVVTGSVNSWTWDFGETQSLTDTSTLRHPTYTYTKEGPKDVRLIVTTTEGCRDTLVQNIQVISKPPIKLSFRDSLICLNDQLQLQAESSGSQHWSPSTGVIHLNANGPLVSPSTTTKYFVDVNLDGCLNRDSVLVRVTDHVNLQTMGDTTICNKDEIQLHIESDGLQYTWTPAESLNNAGIKNPKAFPDTTTRYSVTARIGGCSTSRSFLVSTKPYPIVQAGGDTIICFNTPAFLHASTNGDEWSWLPAKGLSDVHLLNPVVRPDDETSYIFSAKFNDGCPKPGYDTLVVTVRPRIIAYAGNDTVAVVGQPFQLSASGGTQYEWSPSFALSATDIPNPVAQFNEAADNIRYSIKVMNDLGCFEMAYLNIKVYATGPNVFVPTAFTPNQDGLNDVLRPVVVGMKKFEYFKVYNRWGQLVFGTSQEGKGWDGRVNGQVQSNNVYVWMVKAVDFNGHPYFRRGTVTLIR